MIRKYLLDPYGPAAFALITFISLSHDTAAQQSAVLRSTVWENMRDIRPEEYVAPQIHELVVIDGQLTDSAWGRATWSTDFVDIEGPTKPVPRLRTRMKILWDERFLYIGAELEEPDLWATLTEKNTVIFHDDDFEVFIDPDADNHNYYEFEINALNTRWELHLVRPYRDGGPALSGENIEGLLSAVGLEGTLNNPDDRDSGWSVELAIPWDGLRPYLPSNLPPKPGDLWRINFSRVDHALDVANGTYVKLPESGSNNWVWSAQGIVDMHAPERWGIVHFSSSEWPRSTHMDPTVRARDILMEIYYRQKAYRNMEKTYARDLSRLFPERPSNRAGIALIASDSTFEASFYLDLNDTRIKLAIDETGQLRRAN